MKPQPGRMRLPKNLEADDETRMKLAQMIGADDLEAGKPSKPRQTDDSDAEEEDDSSDSELPEDWIERYKIEEYRPSWMSRSSSSETNERSSDDWSTISAELSDETRSGRPDEDVRPCPVDLGPIESNTSDYTDLCGDGGVLKKVSRKGEGPLAYDGYTVDVKYVIRFLDGSVVDVSQNDMWPNKEHKFVVDSGEVVKGLDVIAKNMQRREKSRFRVRMDYAFGEAGSFPKIPPNTAWLVMDVEMMGLRRPHRDKLFLRNNEVLPYVLTRKEQGNEFYKQKEYLKAIHEYKSCIKAISFVDDPIYKADLVAPAVALLSNLAASHLGLKNYRRVIKYCTEVLKHDPSNEKAFYRRAQALRQFPDRLEEARKDFAEAIRLAPNNKALRNEYQELLEEVKMKRKADQKAYGTIFKEQAAIYEKQNPRVFFEVAQGKKLLGRLEMELFSNKVPLTAENFRALCTGEKGGSLSYMKTIFHRVIEGFIIQGGDVSMSGGAGGKSIYGATFKDESLSGKCDRAGLLCMANSGPDTNQSQFFITLVPCPQFDGKYVVFGKVVAGKEVLRKIERVECDSNDRPVEDVRVVKCGECRGKDRMIDSSDEE